MNDELYEFSESANDGYEFISDVPGMDMVLNFLEEIQLQTSPHPLLTTPFEDYTVCEGLLLLLLLSLVISFCLKMLRRAFSWLL